jgi:hypothetical protein
VTELAKSLPRPLKKMTIGEFKYFELKSTYEKIDLPDPWSYDCACVGKIVIKEVDRENQRRWLPRRVIRHFFS